MTFRRRCLTDSDDRRSAVSRRGLSTKRDYTGAHRLSDRDGVAPAGGRSCSAWRKRAVRFLDTSRDLGRGAPGERRGLCREESLPPLSVRHLLDSSAVPACVSDGAAAIDPRSDKPTEDSRAHELCDDTRSYDVSKRNLL